MADLQRTVYPHSGHLSAAGRAQDGQFAGQRPTFCQLCYATIALTSYLHQRGYVLPGVHLFVRLLATSCKNCRLDLHLNFTRDISVDKKEVTTNSGSHLRPKIPDPDLLQ